MRRAALAPLLFSVALLAGCADSAELFSCPATAAGSAFTTGFDDMTVGAAPAGWIDTGASWAVASDANATSGTNILRGEGSPSKGRTSLLAAPMGSYGDFNATIRVNLVSGEHPQGAGLSFRYKDETRYTLIRYSNSEKGWHIFVADGGEVDKKSNATLGIAGDLPKFGQWVDLHVLAAGDHIQAWWGTMKVIDYTETSDTVARSGCVGPFLRGETVALFDDFQVKPL